MDETSESYPVKIRTIDSSQFVIHVTKDTLISELKYLIKTQIQLPEEQQRIIYKGKVLKNPDSLGSYKIERGHVLQLTAGCLQLEPVHQEQEEPRVDAINDILRLAIEISPESFLTRRRQRYHRPRDIDSNERLETIRQNLQTIESMLQSMNSGISDGEILGFDNSRRRLVRGQWIDVRDTVDQWLEAQIIDIQSTPQGSIAYFHYNGWPSRWDEWIPVSSSRIQPLHTHTLQSLAAPMHSPFPINPPDAENARNAGPYDITEFIIQSSSILEQLKGMMERYYSLNTMLRHERAEDRFEEHKNWSTSSDSHFNSDEESLSIEIEDSFVSQSDMTTEQELSLLTVQLASLLDRAGRLLTDLAAVIGGSSQRLPDEIASVSSSLNTNESGVSNNSNRPPLQIPVMPSPSDLASINPRVFGPDISIHIHALFPPR